jgi:FkbM family methyltransferase
VLLTYRFIATHPLTRHRKHEALARWLRWQVSSRLSPYPAVVPYVNQARLLIRSGMAGATGNLYCGLHEFEDMAFVLHFLRESDLFVDVGANVGSYTVLAALTGAKVISFEPVPKSFEALMDNIHLNRMEDAVDARRQAVGAAAGVVSMTADRDTTNHALVAQARYAGKTVQVPQVTLDQALQGLAVPKLIKIDVEGYETQVLEGAAGTLSDPALEALIVELNGSGRQFAVSDGELDRRVRSFGFAAYRYEPVTRTLASLDAAHSVAGNTLYLRRPDFARQTVTSAPVFTVLDRPL